MNFTTPTNLDEVYATLSDIFYYYRIRRESYEVLQLNPLQIDKINFTPLTDQELQLKAQQLLNASQQREVLKLKKEINQSITAMQSKIDSTNQSHLVLVENINSRFNDSQEKIQREAVNKGLLNSNITIAKLAELETAKNNQLSIAESEKNTKISEYQSQIASLTTQLSNADTYYSEVFESELIAKVDELKKEQDKNIIEIQKYNNSITEEEIKYQNRTIQINADLKVKYAQIRGQILTKEELVEMGYYADVISCVCGYYNTLDPSTAYSSFKNQEKLAIYLDDYYSDILYNYRMKAGL